VTVSGLEISDCVISFRLGSRCGSEIKKVIGIFASIIRNNRRMVDWPPYNETLVRRGRVLLDFDVVDGWDLELSQMNPGKVDEPYCYPDSFIELLAYMRAYFHLPYRQTEGVVMTPHYSGLKSNH